MNPLAIRATNVRTFESLDLDLPTGCIVIGGENGAGKSTILNAIDVALFAGRGELPPLLSLGEEELLLELRFEHSGELYRVRRMFSAKGRGKSTLDLERLAFEHDNFQGGDRQEWEPLTRETADATQQHLERILGLSRATFRASSFLAQGDGAAFTEAQPRDRKAILAEILGLAIYDQLLDRTRTDLRAAEDELVKTAALIEGAQELVARKDDVTATLADHRARVATATEALTAADVELEDAQRELAAAAVLAEQVRVCQAELATATAARERAQSDYAASTEATHDLAAKTLALADLAAVADRVPELEQRCVELRTAATEAAELRFRRDQLTRDAEQLTTAHERMVTQARTLHDTAAAARSKADHLEAYIGEAAACETCGQTLGAEAAARAADSYRADAAHLDTQARALDETLHDELAKIAAFLDQANATLIPDVDDPEPVERELAGARRAAEQRAALAERVAQLTELSARGAELEQAFARAAATVTACQAALYEATKTVIDETVLRAKVDRWRVAVAEARQLITERQAYAIRAEADLARIVAAEEQIAAHRQTVEKTQREVDVLKLAERAFGRDGIPALIVENAAIPQLELEANRILGELGGATANCRVELRTQRALKTTDALRETLDIVIVTGAGERAYETFSGGERTRLNLALRIALARLLAHRRGAESRLLAIDEPDGLDAQGMDALARILAGLSGDFDRILVVSHQPQLATSFDQAILVVKDGDRSRVDVGVTMQPSDAPAVIA